jgi:hypothetical protein
VETDIYAFALLVWQVYTNQVPIASEHTDKRVPVRKLILHGVRPTRPSDVVIPDLLWDTMVAGWGPDPTGRPTVAQWLKTLHEIESELKLTGEQDLVEQALFGQSEPSGSQSVTGHFKSRYIFGMRRSDSYIV